jgi:hypothetical protein
MPRAKVTCHAACAELTMCVRVGLHEDLDEDLAVDLHEDIASTNGGALLMLIHAVR